MHSGNRGGIDVRREDIREGMKVRSSDGETLGKVLSLGDSTFIIEKGFFFPKDYEARYDQVSDIRDGEIWVSRSGAEYGTEYGAESRLGEERGAELRGASATEETRIPLAEEELIAEKRANKAGEVRVTKEVITEQKEISVPVTREEVRVERVPASASTQVEEGAFEERSVSVPVYEEEVEIRKRPVVREEVRVAKTTHEEQERATADVRREEARIEDETETRPYGGPGPGETKY